MMGIAKSHTLNDDEDTQQESHDFIAFAANVYLEEVNQTVSNLNNSLSDEEENFPDLQKAYDAFLGECQKLFVDNSNLRSKQIFFFWKRA